jgi:hypothetical protein
MRKGITDFGVIGVNKKGFLIFGALGMALIFALCSPYSLYDTLSEADFLKSETTYEAQDLQALFLDKHGPALMILKPFSLFLGNNFFEPFSGFSFPIPLIDLPLSVLRC